MKDKPEKPTDRTNLFLGDDLDRSSPVACCLSWMAESGFDDDALADQFKRAADLAIYGLLQGGDGAYADGVFPPIVYLYRHALELKLKALVKLAADGKVIELSERETAARKRHNLERLWNVARRAILELWPSSRESDETRLVDEWVLAFSRLDRGSTTLRYTEGFEGQRNAERFPPAADLKHVRSGFDRAYGLLDGAVLGAREAIQATLEARSEMGDVGP